MVPAFCWEIRLPYTLDFLRPFPHFLLVLHSLSLALNIFVFSHIYITFKVLHNIVFY